MCSVHEEGDLLLQKKSDIDQQVTSGTLKCKKCKEERACVIIHVKDPVCRKCFLQYCTHKFRSAFGKTKLVRDGEMALVGYSGGQGSTALLHLVQECLSVRAQKKLRFKPTIVHVDESVITGYCTDTEEVLKVLKNCGFPSYIVPIEKIMSEGDLCLTKLTDDYNYSHKTSNDSEQFLKLLDSVKSLTSKEELLNKLRTSLLYRVAERLCCSKIILGESCTRLSINLLSNIAQGRGAHLPLDTGFADTRNDAVIIRPMREFTSKEVAYYNKLNELRPTLTTSLLTKESSNASINKLTEEFVVGLQCDFPSTVSTIFRTGDKLDIANEDSIESNNKCALCQALLDTKTGDCSALDASLFSDALSTGASSGSNKNESMKMLCYGCRLIVKDMKTTEHLLPYILNNTTEDPQGTVTTEEQSDS